MILSGFGDEIASDFAEQLAVMGEEGIRHIEVRKAWDINVLDLTDDQVHAVKRLLQEHNMQVSALGSPIGKIAITDPFEPHLIRFQRAMEVAEVLGTKNIRVFSFRMPADEDPASYRSEVMRRMEALVAKAEARGLRLCHENEKRIYGDTVERLLDLFHTLASPALGLTFDPANFVQVGVKPWKDGYPALRPFVTYMHMKDAVFSTRRPCPVGEGEAEVEQILGGLAQSGYQGFLSIEPHLKKTEPYASMAEPERFRAASGALKHLLQRLAIPWE